MASSSTAEAVDKITDGFTERVGRAIGAGSWTIEVRNRAHQQVAYNLVLFSRHKDGLWLFGEAASLAQVEWRRACLPPLRDDMLFNPADTFDQEEEERKNRWIRRISENISALLLEHGSFVVEDRLEQVMAGVLGEARERHIRAAVKDLYRQGKTSCNGVGDVRIMRITAAS